MLRFGALAAATAGVATRLRTGPWQRVILVADDSWQLAVGFLGILHAGHTVVLPPTRSAALAAAADPDAITLDPTWLGSVEPANAKLAPLDPARCRIEFFTSGSTGTPKRVARSLAGLQAELDSFEHLWGGTSGCGPVRATVSHQHLYGLTFKVLWPLSAGRPFATETDETWEAALPLLNDETMLVSSPAHLSRMEGLAALPPGRQPRRVFSAGAELRPADSHAAAAQLGTVPTEIFGSTETGAIATRLADATTATAMPWRLFPGIAMRIAEDGRLAVRSPAIDGDGWFLTEDRAAAAAGGFHFLGRADRMAKIEGKRVDLTAVERALADSGLAETAAVFVLQGPRPRLVAAVVPNAAGRRCLAEIGTFRFGRLLRRLLAASHEPAGLPRQWRFVDALPSSRLGKRSEVDLQALFAIRP